MGNKNMKEEGDLVVRQSPLLTCRDKICICGCLHAGWRESKAILIFMSLTLDDIKHHAAQVVASKIVPLTCEFKLHVFGSKHKIKEY